MPENIIEVHHINKSFGGVHALNDVSLEIRQGEIHSLIGENGSGKSTLIKVISGAYAADSGEILIGGRKYSRLTPGEAMAALRWQAQAWAAHADCQAGHVAAGTRQLQDLQAQLQLARPQGGRLPRLVAGLAADCGRRRH